MTEKQKTPQEIVDLFTSAFGNGVREAKIRERAEGAKKNKNYNIWFRLDRALLKPAIEKLIGLSFPHLAVISGSDLGDEVELLYHFSIYYGTRHGEYMVTIGVSLPKSDLAIPTISDLIPGAVFSEREKQEFLGIKVGGIPDDRRLFLPEEFPQGVYPWRKDETGIRPELVKDLWAVGRPKDRPAPPVPPKPEKKETQPEAKPEDVPEKKTGTGPEWKMDVTVKQEGPDHEQ